MRWWCGVQRVFMETIVLVDELTSLADSMIQVQPPLLGCRRCTL